MFSRVAWVAFPTDYLSSPQGGPQSGAAIPIVSIPAAPAGGATYIELAFTSEPQATVEREFALTDRHLVLYIRLPQGIAAFLDYYHADWEDSDLRVTGDGKVADLLFSSKDPRGTGRPIRITFGPTPKDGDAVVIRELGGYPVR